VKKLLDHFVKSISDGEIQNERKIELLKAEVIKAKNELSSFRAM
jgi:hypothetical protein